VSPIALNSRLHMDTNKLMKSGETVYEQQTDHMDNKYMLTRRMPFLNR